jgi:NAD+ synthase (glutamine-hydrolysing)
VATSETCLATELCEELFTPNAPHVALFLAGVEILANGSGSHHQLRKLNTRINLVKVRFDSGRRTEAVAIHLRDR